MKKMTLIATGLAVLLTGCGIDESKVLDIYPNNGGSSNCVVATIDEFDYNNRLVTDYDKLEWIFKDGYYNRQKQQLVKFDDEFDDELLKKALKNKAFSEYFMCKKEFKNDKQFEAKIKEINKFGSKTYSIIESDELEKELKNLIEAYAKLEDKKYTFKTRAEKESKLIELIVNKENNIVNYPPKGFSDLIFINGWLQQVEQFANNYSYQDFLQNK